MKQTILNLKPHNSYKLAHKKPIYIFKERNRDNIPIILLQKVIFARIIMASTTHDLII